MRGMQLHWWRVASRRSPNPGGIGELPPSRRSAVPSAVSSDLAPSIMTLPWHPSTKLHTQHGRGPLCTGVIHSEVSCTHYRIVCNLFGILLYNLRRPEVWEKITIPDARTIGSKLCVFSGFQWSWHCDIHSEGTGRNLRIFSGPPIVWHSDRPSSWRHSIRTGLDKLSSLCHLQSVNQIGAPLRPG